MQRDIRVMSDQGLIRSHRAFRLETHLCLWRATANSSAVEWIDLRPVELGRDCTGGRKYSAVKVAVAISEPPSQIRSVCLTTCRLTPRTSSYAALSAWRKVFESIITLRKKEVSREWIDLGNPLQAVPGKRKEDFRMFGEE
ncbi:hypothetical protein Q8A67_023614 [Cirrhinus molitorella]|uniref:Uncharacterized protein n=1 Tax=Cirrhinus molitorella TaxID=172907 RepID=A0AA88TCQ7_9TELE|nr:hypothetical protein Q8A67_023614 [Cirrhinus molitorella]